MFEKQNQNVQKNSLAVQAGGDVNIGMSYSEVKDLIMVLFENNFPKLREIAQNTAIENVEKFTAEFEKKIKENLNEIDINKFKEPDIQYSLNDAIQASARKGENIDILSELLIERVKIGSVDLLSIVSAEAVNCLPKINKQHIHFLSFHQMMYSLFLSTIKKYEDLEHLANIIHSVTNSTFKLSESNIRYLEYVGLLSKDYSVVNHFYKKRLENYDFMKNVSYDIMDKEIEKLAPSFYPLVKICEDDCLSQINLTPIGQLIALINIKKVLPIKDYSIWIK